MAGLGTPQADHCAHARDVQEPEIPRPVGRTREASRSLARENLTRQHGSDAADDGLHGKTERASHESIVALIHVAFRLRVACKERRKQSTVSQKLATRVSVARTPRLGRMVRALSFGA